MPASASPKWKMRWLNRPNGERDVTINGITFPNPYLAGKWAAMAIEDGLAGEAEILDASNPTSRASIRAEHVTSLGDRLVIEKLDNLLSLLRKRP